LFPALHAHLPCTTLLNSEECALLEKEISALDCNTPASYGKVRAVFLNIRLWVK